MGIVESEETNTNQFSVFVINKSIRKAKKESVKRRKEVEIEETEKHFITTRRRATKKKKS
jgi:hypothetical protein